MATSATIHNLIMRRALMALAALAASMLLVLGMAALPAHAQSAPSGTSITVNTTADENNTDGDCSLREAIAAANANQATDACPAGSGSGEDAIGFGPSTGSLSLNGQLPKISDAAGLVVKGPKQITASSVGFRALWVNAGAKLALRDLSFGTSSSGFNVRFGQQEAPGRGGVIYNDGGTLVVNGGTYSFNYAGDSGGAIYSGLGGTLEVTGSTFRGNHSFDDATNGAAAGGGIFTRGTAKVTNSTFSDNRAMYAQDVIGKGRGGGIYNDWEGTLVVDGSTFRGNRAYWGGGGIANHGTLQVTNSTFFANSISNYVLHSDIGAHGGAGIFNWSNDGSSEIKRTGQLEVTNSTFFENNADGDAGGTYGRNIQSGGSADRVTLHSTILAMIPGGRGVNCSPTAPFKDGGYNISSDNTCGLDGSSGSGTSWTNADPKLDSAYLQNNGGPTQTIALQDDSLAIDAIEEGVNGCATNITQDQRGVTRPQGGGCDIGAFEAPPDVTAPEAPTIASPAEGTLNPGYFTVSGTAGPYNTVELFEDTDSRGTVMADRFGKWSVDLTGVSDGPHSYTAKATDRSGNTSTESAVHVVSVDAIAPDAPLITRPTEGSINDDGFFFVVGRAEPGAKVELFENATSKGTDTADPDGRWGIALSRVADGTYSYTAKATDGLGNVSDLSKARTIIVDKTAPGAPLITYPAQGARLNYRSFSLFGTAEAGAQVELFEGALSKGTATAGTDGKWTIALSEVSEGSHSYTAKATDQAGNTSAPSSTRTVIVDLTKPKVISAAPAEGATAMPYENVTATFSEAMKATTINAYNFRLFKGGSTTPITAPVSYDPTAKKATLNPSTDLEAGVTYKAVVTTGAKDLAGNALDQDPSVTGNQQKVWFFTISQ